MPGLVTSGVFSSELEKKNPLSVAKVSDCLFFICFKAHPCVLYKPVVSLVLKMYISMLCIICMIFKGC